MNKKIELPSREFIYSVMMARSREIQAKIDKEAEEEKTNQEAKP